MNLEQIKRTYDRRAASYDRTVGLGERLLVGDLRRRFGALLAGETLEVAVGSGLNLPYYSDAVTRAVGIDLSPGMLAEARSRAEGLGHAIELVEGDAQRLPFPDASFDTVAISLGLCTVPDPVRALGEMARVCRPGGRIVLLEHVRSTVSPLVWLQVLLSPVQERLMGCHLARSTFETARDLGFGVDEVATRLAGVFRLAVLTPPGERRGRSADPSTVMSCAERSRDISSVTLTAAESDRIGLPHCHPDEGRIFARVVSAVGQDRDGAGSGRRRWLDVVQRRT